MTNSFPRHPGQQPSGMAPQPHHQQTAGAPLPGFTYPVPGGQHGSVPMPQRSAHQQPHVAQPMVQLPYGHTHHPPVAMAAAAPTPTAYKTRLRWENILPMLAVVALVIAGGLFFKDRESILTGTDPDAPKSSQVEAAGSGTTQAPAAAGAMTMTPEQIEQKITQINALIAAGSYAQAGLLLQPLASMAGSNPTVAALQKRLASVESKNARLLRQLGRQQASGRWAGMLVTLAAIEKLHPLSATQQKMRTRASAAVAAQRAAARRSSASTPARPTSTTRPPVQGGGSTASAPTTTAPPTIGSGTGGGQPPAPPSLPNPTGGTGVAAPGAPGTHAGHTG